MLQVVQISISINQLTHFITSVSSKMSSSTAELQNEDLHKIRDILVPSKPGTEPLLVPPGSESSRSSGGISTNANTEFIPHIFYTLYKIQKDPNNSSNQLENKTGVIKHRLRSCKTLIKDSNSVVELLGKSPEEWEQFIASRDRELQLKKNVLLDLQRKIADVLESSGYTPTEDVESNVKDQNTSVNGDSMDVDHQTGDGSEKEDDAAVGEHVNPVTESSQNIVTEQSKVKTTSESPDNSVPVSEVNGTETTDAETLPAGIDQGSGDIDMEL